MFFSSSINMTDDWNPLGIYGVYASIIIILLIPTFLNRNEVSYNKKIFGLMYVFFITSLLAAILNSELQLLISSVSLFCLFLSASIILPSYLKTDTEKVIAISLLVANIPLLLLPILTEGIKLPSYAGIFNNTNSLGIVASTVFTVFSALFFGELEKILFRKAKVFKLKIVVYLLLMLLSLLIVVFSVSRTSFLACLLVFLAGIVFIVFLSIKHRVFPNILMKMISVLPILIFIYFLFDKFIPINFYVQENILGKFERKSADIFDGRGMVWEQTIKEATIFGNGTNYFEESVGLGAHNTFISILGVYGWLSLIPFFLFFIFGLYYCSRYVLIMDTGYKYLPILILINFLTTSMAEAMLYKVSMLASLVLIGVCASKIKPLIHIK